MARIVDDVQAQTTGAWTDHPRNTNTQRTKHLKQTGVTAYAEVSAFTGPTIRILATPKIPAQARPPKTTRQPAAIPMALAAENDQSIAISRPSRKKPAKQRAVSSTPHRRARRYALTQTVVLILLLIVALSSVLLLQQRRSTFRVESDVKTAPLPAIATQPEGLDSPHKSSRPQSPLQLPRRNRRHQPRRNPQR